MAEVPGLQQESDRLLAGGQAPRHAAVCLLGHEDRADAQGPDDRSGGLATRDHEAPCPVGDGVLCRPGQDLFEDAEKKGPLTTPAYRTTLDNCQRWAGPEGIDAVMEKHRLDALVAPMTGPAWPTDHLNGDHVLGSSSTSAAVAGYPHVVVPAGEVSGLPVGISFFGRAWSEATLIRLAYAFEQATHHRRVPRFVPTVAP